MNGIEVRTDRKSPGMDTSTMVFTITQQYAGATVETLAAAFIHDSYHAYQARHGMQSYGDEAEREASKFTVPVLKAIGGFSAGIIADYDYDATHGHGQWGTTAPKPGSRRRRNLGIERVTRSGV
jgi:hypothetical protein